MKGLIFAAAFLMSSQLNAASNKPNNINEFDAPLPSLLLFDVKNGRAIKQKPASDISQLKYPIFIKQKSKRDENIPFGNKKDSRK